MLEDVLGWAVVLTGAIVMRFTALTIIDPLLSIGVALFILMHAVRNLKEAFSLFLKKVPKGIDIHEIKAHILQLPDVLDVHHVHVWSIDGQCHYATMHVVARGEAHSTKHAIREELKEHGISHVTIEWEAEGEECHEKHCHTDRSTSPSHHYHHHHG